ncbi:seven-hairpin glycosidase [Aureobasidium subglaciale]|nr:seven-hairpin glycosidase [Aureobasidium subglaciale]KAI5213482.1 seven-hairpin glycosidase [Aureobasidium subglaciale]KAI5215156.1 seven-hairpin glycosidase [Aureobasidium subglaciale]KAI5253194.1 seven-hairpin glycosidase [Aureobasidium subglaciale]
MIRYRRYRAFIAFTVIAILATYYFIGHGGIDLPSAIGAGSLKAAGNDAAAAAKEKVQAGLDLIKPDEPTKEDILGVLPPLPTTKAAPATTKIVAEAPKPSTEKTTTSSAAVATETPTRTPLQDAAAMLPPVHELDDMTEIGEGRFEIPPTNQGQVSVPEIHWSRQDEHFPVATTIQLPTGTPKAIPRIQHKFKKESSADKADREEKLKIIEGAVSHSWSGYRSKAWLKDEVRPVSGGSRDPFCGWAATLVDALDTLWIVGLKDDFEEAVKAVGKIDFTTSQRKDIPLFETTIRYLGGMLSAYDLSGAKHKVLLDKAVELADVLMGSFDTPNRMPVTFYRWMPTFASQPHRAGTHVVLAELGSLSVEFTRLAQLTKEPKYYDAIDRITDAFLEWQNASGVNATLIPGLFPVHVDASGCEKPAQIKSHYSHPAGKDGDVAVGDGEPVVPERPVTQGQGTRTGASTEKDGSSQPVNAGGSRMGAASAAGVGKIIGWDDPLTEGDLDNPQVKAAVLDSNSAELNKRQIGDVENQKEKAAEDVFQKETQAKMHTLQKEVCVPRGLASSSGGGHDTFTIGGMADSLYEYFPKQYLLLGGLEGKYKTLYEQSIDAVTKHLLFRPMTPENADILFAGEYTARAPSVEGTVEGALKAEGAHLTCFAGGMYAMGAKIFGREEDLELGAKLAEGCVWAYNATVTGIMPEHFLVSKCDSMTDCKWNKTKYWEELDPYAATRTQVNLANPLGGDRNAPQVGAKRDLDGPAATIDHVPAPAVPNSIPELDVATPADAARVEYTPPTPPTHEEFVLARISEERLPPGMTRLLSRSYILRPEAIESIFYLYRITGDAHWREVGWQMFLAVQKYTHTTYGASALDDVTKTVPGQVDSEESFWLAETLKYFYLLFEEEGVISLDEWVLNTEAHPFRRPDAPVYSVPAAGVADVEET